MNSSMSERGSTLLLFGLVVISALAVVTNIDTRRQLFSAMQIQRQGLDQTNSHWRQLLLEQAAQSAQVEVDNIAHQRLQMVFPDHHSTIVVNP